MIQRISDNLDILVIVALVIVIGTCAGRGIEREGTAACRAMIAKARTSADSIAVFAAKPASRYATCSERLLVEAP